MLTNVGVDTATAAARRRQRRLRSWLRHERMTVAMTLAEMTHHTSPRGPKMARVGEEVVHDAHEALRGQKTPPPGTQPAALREPGLQLVSEHAGCPWMRRGGLRLRPFPRGFCVGGQEGRMRRRSWRGAQRRRCSLLAVPRALRTPEQLRRIDELVAESLARSGMRKRKKRKKKKLPRGRARHRQRQRPLSGYGALIVNSGRGMCKAGFSTSAQCSLWLQTGPDARHHGRYGTEEQLRAPLFCSSHCVSFPVFRPEMLGIMAGLDQKDFGMCKAWFAGI